MREKIGLSVGLSVTVTLGLTAAFFGIRKCRRRQKAKDSKQDQQEQQEHNTDPDPPATEQPDPTTDDIRGSPRHVQPSGQNA